MTTFQGNSLINRPRGFFDANSNLIQESFIYTSVRIVYDGSNNPIYIGNARPGTAENHNGWQIFKCAYDGANNLLSIKWPLDSQGLVSNDFVFVWDDGVVNYTNYTYM